MSDLLKISITDEALRAALGRMIATLHDTTPLMQALSEIMVDAQAEGLRIDAFVCPIGSGAVCTGVGKRLREVFPDMRLMAIRADIPGFSELGGMPSEVLEQSLITETLGVSADDAAGARRRLFAMESINAGLETGAALFGALTLARRPEFQNKNIVCIAGEGRNV